MACPRNSRPVFGPFAAAGAASTAAAAAHVTIAVASLDPMAPPRSRAGPAPALARSYRRPPGRRGLGGGGQRGAADRPVVEALVDARAADLDVGAVDVDGDRRLVGDR